jgi:multicomponent Na+:H+ antiporter subunit D
MLAPVMALAGITILMGLCMEAVIQYALYAAGQLMDPQPYIRAVLGGG